MTPAISETVSEKRGRPRDEDIASEVESIEKLFPELTTHRARQGRAFALRAWGALNLLPSGEFAWLHGNDPGGAGIKWTILEELGRARKGCAIRRMARRIVQAKPRAGCGGDNPQVAKMPRNETAVSDCGTARCGMRYGPRRIIRNPGPRKLQRWQTSLHEAGHCVAYSQLCGTWACGRVFGYGGKGGVCTHGRPQGPIDNDVIAIASGVAAGGFAGWLPCPAGRPRRIRGALPSTPDNDMQIDRYIERLNREADRTDAPHISPAAPEKAAERFVRGNLSEIVRIAQRLFLKGRAYVPAPPKQTQGAADVPPCEITRIAASAAKGF